MHQTLYFTLIVDSHRVKGKLGIIFTPILEMRKPRVMCKNQSADSWIIKARCSQALSTPSFL